MDKILISYNIGIDSTGQYHTKLIVNYDGVPAFFSAFDFLSGHLALVPQAGYDGLELSRRIFPAVATEHTWIYRITMLITQKKQYALRAIYELAKKITKGPIKTAQIAEAQAIPQRFLEIILNRLKHAGIVNAKRGYCGGFQLERPPNEITVEDVFKSMEEIDEATVCVSCISKTDCPFYGACAFLPVWNEMQSAIDNICRSTTIQTLLDNEAAGPLGK